MKSKKKIKAKKTQKRITLNKEEINVNLRKLQEDVKTAYNSMKRVLPEAIKDAKVKRFGNASHIILPKGYAGKKAIVLIKKIN